jgi:hypothetical protein
MGFNDFLGGFLIQLRAGSSKKHPNSIEAMLGKTMAELAKVVLAPRTKGPIFKQFYVDSSVRTITVYNDHHFDT